MHSITPLYYPELNEHVINIENVSLIEYFDNLTSKNIQLTKILFSYIETNNKARLFNGKKLTLKKENNNFNCTFFSSLTEDNILFLNNDYTGFINVNDRFTIFDTFNINEDNSAITITDIYERLIATEFEELNVEENGLQIYQQFSGKSGLLDDFNLTKLGYIPYHFSKEITLSLTLSTKLRLNKIKNYQEFNRINFRYISNNGDNIDFDFIKIKNNQIIILNVFDSYEIKELNLKIIEEDEKIFNIYLSLTTNSNITNQTGLLYYGVKNYEQLNVKDDFPLNENILLFNNNEILLLKSDLRYCTKKTINTTITDGLIPTKAIKLADDLNKLFDIKNSGYYYGNDLSNTLDAPEKKLEYYDFQVFFNADDITKPISCQLIFQKTNKVYLGTYNYVNNIIEWNGISLDEHTHPATEIIEDSEHNFVTEEEKIKWNSNTNAFWKNPVNTKTELLAIQNPQNGLVCTVINDVIQNTVYIYSNNNWVKISAHTLPVDSAIENSLVSPETLNKINNSGIAKEVVNETKKIFIHKETDSTNQSILNRIGNNTIDIVKRLIMPIKNIGMNALLIGFENMLAGNKSIAIGSNIDVLDNSIGIGNEISNLNIGIGEGLIGNKGIVIGKYNKDVIDNEFIVANGNDNDNRQNLLTLNAQGILKLKENGGFSIENKTNNDLLLADGTTIERNLFLDSSEKDNFITNKNTILLTLITDDNNEIDFETPYIL